MKSALFGLLCVIGFASQSFGQQYWINSVPQQPTLQQSQVVVQQQVQTPVQQQYNVVQPTKQPDFVHYHYWMGSGQNYPQYNVQPQQYQYVPQQQYYYVVPQQYYTPTYYQQPSWYYCR